MSKKKKTVAKKEPVVELPKEETPEKVEAPKVEAPKAVVQKVPKPAAPVGKKAFKKNLVRLDKYARTLVGARNVELVNAWANKERRNGKYHDSKENYRARYEEFTRS